MSINNNWYHYYFNSSSIFHYYPECNLCATKYALVSSLPATLTQTKNQPSTVPSGPSTCGHRIPLESPGTSGMVVSHDSLWLKPGWPPRLCFPCTFSGRRNFAYLSHLFLRPGDRSLLLSTPTAASGTVPLGKPSTSVKPKCPAEPALTPPHTVICLHPWLFHFMLWGL